MVAMIRTVAQFFSPGLARAMSVTAEITASASRITVKGLIKAENRRFATDSRFP